MMRRENRDGFTLIEILIASSIMVVLLGLVLAVATQALETWRRTSESLEMEVSARLALDILTGDLETAFIPELEGEWVRAEPEQMAMPAQIPLQASSWLTFLSPVRDRIRTGLDGQTEYGDVCAVSYRVYYQNAIFGGPENAVLGLYRSVMSPSRTYLELRTQGERGSTLFQGFWKGTAAADTIHPAAFLIGNIVKFQITFTLLDGEGKLATSDAHIPFTLGAQYAGVLQYADISITLLSRLGGKLLNDLIEERVAIPLERILNENGREFSRRVAFMR